MQKNHYYNKRLKHLARELRNNPTKAERRLWYDLIANKQFGDYQFLRQRPIERFIVDFYCKELRLVIEVDGKSHEFEDVLKKDLIKTKRLLELGFRIIRFSDWEVLNDLGLVQELLYTKIEEILANHPPDPPRGRQT